LLPLVALGLSWLRRPPRHNPWLEQVDAHLLRHLLLERQRLSRLPVTLLLIAWLLAVLVLAGPTWSRHAALQFRPAVSPLVVVLDLSRSMDAVDLRPSRLAVAKARLQQLLQQLPPRPVGLVVFAAQGHSVMPLTEDGVLISEILAELETDLMPVQGSNPGAGLLRAQELLQRAGETRGDVLLVTDGVDREAVAFSRRLADEGITSSVLALATPQGGPIPEGEDYLLADGEPVVPRLDTGALQAVADAGQGVYALYRRDGGDLQLLLAGLERPLSAGQESPMGEGEVWQEQGPWLLLFLLPLSLLAFRRGWEARDLGLPTGGAKAGLGAALVVLGLQLPTAEALEWADLWWRADQQEARALREGRSDRLKSLAHDLLWRGIVHYRQGEHELALGAFSVLDSPMAHYNRGNALVQLGRLEAALSAYERVLQQDPKHRDARFNRDLVQAELVAAMQEEGQDEAPLQAQEDKKAAETKVAEAPPVAPYAEDFLEPPEGRLKTEVPDVPGPDDSPGSLGAGAILLEGREDTEGKEGPGMGQSADAGEPGEQEDSPELTRPGRVPGRQEPSPGGDEEMQALTEDKPVAGPDAQQEQQRAGGGLHEDAPAGSGGEEGEGQTGESLASEDRPLESAVEPMRAQTKEGAGLGMRQGLEEELQQAMMQWLARIPDEPAGLLREKFLREYRRNPSKPAGLDPW